ncbi:uncharacterized protein J3D65DRAFT_607175 [Phyllosticta citribraziliensis]|uniref:Uncharacterized protein n=1 Tax=Phyllosticta citribraziliensis TaxID=989973 RepID=A0ABR1L6X3_9PEZI
MNSNNTINNNCGCTLSALRVLMHIEQLEGTAVALETLLELMESAEVNCLMVLDCETCRQQRFSLASVTVLSTCVIDWVRRGWLGEENDNTDNDENSATNTNNIDKARITLGSYDLDPADAETLSRELIALRLSPFSKLMALLNGALSSLRSGQTDAYLEIVQANVHQLRDCAQRIKTLSAAPN